MENNYKVLIIEDEMSTQKQIMKYIMESAQFGNVEIAHDFKEALLKLQENNYDLLIINVNFNNDAGFLVLETLHNPPDIIFITDSRKYENLALNMGVVDYLLKPLTKKRFNVALDCFLSRR